ncbi:MAG TPA: cyclopropane-fatty-acyl-phospholipid synthase family protein [Mycobacteriales bacterium]|jgi:cyclopropane-fatty-acyl-phospholipid synthase|nr:cyclopropane-fatty-acyl-phospholipid synthase family protein [Mycobacteriales bacterium]
MITNVTSTSIEPTALGAISLGRWPDLAPPRAAPLRAALARVVMRRVARRAQLRVDLPDGSHLGPDEAPRLTVHSPDGFFTRLGRDGKIGFGEGFMSGDWDAPDPAAVIEPLARNIDTLVPRWLQWARGVYDARRPADEDNDLAGARRNIHRHYDLSNDLFALFLDETMTYSAALFDDPSHESLAVGQRRKIDRLLDEACVTRGSRVLEIGTGWGELAIRAARRGASVTTITLSEEQAALAIERAKAAGVAGLVDVRLCDYRDIDGKYDAIVSVEMIEAVGERWWPTYFEVLDRRLAANGRVGLQAIVMPHRRMLAARRSHTWIHKYIFPGGIIPSAEAIKDIVAHRTSLQITDALRFGSSYAETLRRWQERFVAATSAVDALGFDETFRRMWRFYLAYCEGGFRAGYLDVVQFTMRHAAASA